MCYFDCNANPADKYMLRVKINPCFYFKKQGVGSLTVSN
jgi:hypothetical protein